MIIFATQDPERILGLPKSVPSLAIACIRRSYVANLLEKQVKAFFCLEDHADITHVWTTDELLKHAKTQAFIKKTSNNLMVFKNIPKIQKLAEKRGWNLINNHPKFNQIFEDKIEFAKTCSELQISTPKTILTHLKDTNYKELKAKLGTKFVVQFRRGHAGDSTHFIKSEKDWQNLMAYKSQYPAKITQFLSGPTLTYNVCIADGHFLYSNLMYQINAYPDFNNNEGGTCGIDIEYAKKYREYEAVMKTEINKLAKHLQDLGYKGLFGVDLILQNKKAYIIECNPRFTSNLALNNQIEPISLMARHIKAFLPHTKLKKTSNARGSYLILRNNFKKSVLIKNAPKSGKHIIGSHEYWLIAEPPGSLISPNNKLASIITKKSILTKQGKIKKTAYQIQSQFKLKEVYISPLDFWQNEYATPKKALINVFKKPLKNYAQLSDNALNRNRQTQCRKDEGTFELLGEHEESYLIRKWDGTHGWVNKKDISKRDENPLKIVKHKQKKADIEQFLKKYLGTVYLWGGLSSRGIDCSGLVQRYFLELFGLRLPKHSRDQMKEGKSVLTEAEIKRINTNSQLGTAPAAKLQNHDLIFLRQKSSKTSHVGIFLDEKLLHASLGQKAVVQQDLSEVLQEYKLVATTRIL